MVLKKDFEIKNGIANPNKVTVLYFETGRVIFTSISKWDTYKFLFITILYLKF